MEITTQVMIDSLEISKLVESRHDNVKRTIKTLHKRGVIQLPQTEEIENKQSLSSRKYSNA